MAGGLGYEEVVLQKGVGMGLGLGPVLGSCRVRLWGLYRCLTHGYRASPTPGGWEWQRFWAGEMWGKGK